MAQAILINVTIIYTAT